jgi:hypothetical protein
VTLLGLGASPTSVISASTPTVSGALIGSNLPTVVCTCTILAFVAASGALLLSCPSDWATARACGSGTACAEQAAIPIATIAAIVPMDLDFMKTPFRARIVKVLLTKIEDQFTNSADTRLKQISRRYVHG